MIAVLAPAFNRLQATLTRRPAPLLAPCPLDAPFPLAHPDHPLPAWVAADPLVAKYRALLGDLPWHQFPERPTDRPWPGPQPDPRAPFVAAFLVKLHEGKRYMSDLRTYLVEHPALVYLLGFPRQPDPTAPHGFDVAATVPDRRQLSRVLRTLPNAALQFLLTASVDLLRASLPAEQQPTFGALIAGDTQAILAWVKENNPKQSIKEGRLDKTKQPVGDPDCKLGVKSRANTSPVEEEPPTPTTDAQPAGQLQIGVDILWGYASGIVVTRLPDGTEIVLAERTRPFNERDISYFFPLKDQVEQRLGRRPRTGIWDAAYDAHYVYDYFDQVGGQAIVPLVAGKRGRAPPVRAGWGTGVRGGTGHAAALHLPAPHRAGAAPTREMRLSAAAAAPDGPDLPDQRPALCQGGLHDDARDESRGAHPPPVGPGERGVQAVVRPTHDGGADQQSGGSPGDHPPEAAAWGSDRQPQHADLCAH